MLASFNGNGKGMRNASEPRLKPPDIATAETMREPAAAFRRASVRIFMILAATLAGWVVASIGVGMGMPRASGSFAGVALAVMGVAAGTALLALAGLMLFRSARGWVRLILVPWIVLVLVDVYSLSIALAAAYPPHPPSDSEPPSGAVRVQMTSADGVTLSGWYLPSRNGAAVVLRHGAGSTAAATVDHARALHNAGYGVLATDARGHGDSDGQGMDLGWYGDSDIRAAIDALGARPEVDPGRIGVVGLSMGGEEVIGAAGADERIRAVVAEGATGRTAADKEWLADEYGAAGVVQGVLDRITYAIVDLLTPPEPPPTLAQSVQDSGSTPLLLIAAGEDPDERSVASRLAAVDPARVEVWIVPGAEHVQALPTEPDEWQTRVVGFLDTALHRGGAP